MVWMSCLPWPVRSIEVGLGPFSDGMKLLIPREWAAGEKRVAVTPETVRRLQGRNIAIEVERGAGEAAGFPDALYNAIGASVVDGEDLDWAGAAGVLCVQPPSPSALERMREGSLLVGLLAPHGAQDLARILNQLSLIHI